MIGLLKKIFETKQSSNALLGLTPTTAQNKTKQNKRKSILRLKIASLITFKSDHYTKTCYLPIELDITLLKSQQPSFILSAKPHKYTSL